MHYYMFNPSEFNNDARHLTLVERAIYRDLIDMYYTTEQPIDASDMPLLQRKLLCRTDDEKQALQIILDEFFTFNKKSNKYEHKRIKKEIKNYHRTHYVTMVRKLGELGIKLNLSETTFEQVKSLYELHVTNKFTNVTNNNRNVTNVTPNVTHEKTNVTPDVTNVTPDVTNVTPNVTRNVTDVTSNVTQLCDVDSIINLDDDNDLSDSARRAKRTRLKKQCLINDLASIGYDVSQLNTNTKMATLETLHKQNVTPNVTHEKTGVTPDVTQRNATSQKIDAINIKQETLNTNQKPNLKTSLSQTREVDKKSITDWSPALADVMHELNQDGFDKKLNPDEFQRHLHKFQAYWQNEEAKDNYLITEQIRITKLANWIKREWPKLTPQQPTKITNSNAPVMTDWQHVGRKGKQVAVCSDMPTIYHPSHKPIASAPVNTAPAKTLPGMDMTETTMYLVTHKAPGETQQQTYKRLLAEMEEAG